MFFFLSTHLLDVFDTLLIREKNHLQTEQHNRVAYLSIRRMKLIQKEKLISSTYGASTNTPFAEPRPLLGKRPSPQERDTHRRAHGRLENRKGAWKVLLGTRAARLLPLPSPHDLLSDDHNHRGSLSTMRVPRSPDPEVGPENLYLQQVSPDHP